MSFPTLAVEVAFSSRPTETPVWTDVADKVLSITTSRGRDSEFGPMPMGTAEIALDNTDRRFDPTYEGMLVNYIQNPSAEIDTSWWIITGTGTVTRNAAAAYVGSASFAIGKPPSGNEALRSPDVSCGGSEAWTFSFYVSFDGTTWNRYFYTVTTSAAATSISVQIYLASNDALAVVITDSTGAYLYNAYIATVVATQVYVDACQLELNDHATAYCDGDQGSIVNYIVNPSAEIDLTGWNSISGGIVRSTTPGYAHTGYCSFLFPNTLTRSMESDLIACVGNQQWNASCYVKENGIDLGRLSATITTASSAVWVSLYVQLEVASQIARIFIFDSAGTNSSAHAHLDTFGSSVTFDSFQLEKGAAATAYCDGDQTGDFWYGGAHVSYSGIRRNAFSKWSGAPHASTSIRGGQYTGTVFPMRRIRVLADDYPIFSGYIDGWPQTWLNGVDPVVTVRASDGMKVLARYELNETFTAELSGARIGHVLDSVGWNVGGAWALDSATNSQLDSTTILAPNGDRALSDGISTIMAHTLENTNALQYIMDVTDSENGIFFIGADGAAYFYGRRDLSGTTPATVFDDAVGALNYMDYALDYDDSLIFNDVRMTRVDGVEQLASDAASQADYFKRTTQNDRLLLTTDADVADRANYMVGRYKQPHYRSRGLSLGGSDVNWDVLLRREIGDRIQVTRRPQGGTPITLLYRIEGIEHTIARDGQQWFTKYKLSTADTQAYWLISTGADAFAANAVLGTTTVLGY